MMLVLCLILSLQQVGLKATPHDMTPILQVALRSGIGAVLVVHERIKLYSFEKGVDRQSRIS